MSAEIIMAASSVGGVVVVAVGLVATWRKNGKSQAARDQELKDDLKAVIRRLDDPNTGLSAMDRNLNEVQKNCAGTVAGFNERLKTLEK